MCSISITSLYAFLERYNNQTGDLDKLFEKNIRRFLGGRGKVNRGIQQTLNESPDLFGLYNNGITMVVRSFHTTDTGSLRLIDPYVVNGCQTTRTIWEVCRQRLAAGGHGTDPGLDAWKKKAERGMVVTKIVKVVENDETMLRNITRYTNSQNAVKEKDFLALDSDFKIWKSGMEETYAIYLEIQRGAWDSQRAWQRQHPSNRQFTKHANAFDLLKVYGAGWMSEAGNAFGRNAAFLPNGSSFKKIVNNDEGKFGVDDLYAAYCLQAAGEKYEFGRTGKKPTRRLTRFLFYTVCVELLKGIMVRANMPTRAPDITEALLKLLPSDQHTLLLDNSIEAIDEYLTTGTDNSIFDEPVFNGNLNTYLKSDQLSKEGTSPVFKRLIADVGRALARGKPSPRDIITKILLP